MGEETFSVRRGRPELPDGKKRNKLVQFRLTEEELERVHTAALRNGGRLSEWVRYAVLGMADIEIEAEGLIPNSKR